MNVILQNNIVQELHYAKFGFCVAGGEGLAPPFPRKKKTRFCVANTEMGWRHRRHARSFRQAKPPLFDEPNTVETVSNAGKAYQTPKMMLQMRDFTNTRQKSMNMSSQKLRNFGYADFFEPKLMGGVLDPGKVPRTPKLTSRTQKVKSKLHEQLRLAGRWLVGVGVHVGNASLTEFNPFGINAYDELCKITGLPGGSGTIALNSSTSSRKPSLCGLSWGPPSSFWLQFSDFDADAASKNPKLYYKSSGTIFTS